jgi:uncharacterized protein
MRTTPVSTPIRATVWCAVLLACLAAPAARGTEIPYLAGRVNDTAELLSDDTKQELESLLRQHEDSTSNQVVVLTITSLESESIEEYAIRVVDTWKLGQKGKDNGVLLLVAKDDRQVRIEVGRGLEGELTDALSAQIIRREIVPNFKGGDYDRGVRAGVDAILGAIAGSYTADDSAADGGESFPMGIFVFLFFLSIVGLFTLIALITPGGTGWFLYAFLLPFWGVFPYATLGAPVGPAMGLLYALGFPLLKILLPKSTWGAGMLKKIGKGFTSGGRSSGGSGGSSSGGWSSGGGSSSGGGFSGGGGSFSGGGSSGSW